VLEGCDATACTVFQLKRNSTMPQSTLSLKQQVEIRKVFKVFDGDNSGSIGLKELRLAIRALGVEVDQEKIKQLVRAMDFNDSGEIELDEFETIVSKYVSACSTFSSLAPLTLGLHDARYMIRNEMGVQRANDAFGAFDRENKGYIVPEVGFQGHSRFVLRGDVAKFVHTARLGRFSNTLQDILRVADNAGQKITQAELAKIISSKKTMIVALVVTGVVQCAACGYGHTNSPST